jgi:hypothetical protein
MTRIITGILLKSYMAVARLMGDVDKRRKRSLKQRAAHAREAIKKVSLKEA